MSNIDAQLWLLNHLLGVDMCQLDPSNSETESITCHFIPFSLYSFVQIKVPLNDFMISLPETSLVTFSWVWHNLTLQSFYTYIYVLHCFHSFELVEITFLFYKTMSKQIRPTRRPLWQIWTCMHIN